MENTGGLTSSRDIVKQLPAGVSALSEAGLANVFYTWQYGFRRPDGSIYWFHAAPQHNSILDHKIDQVFISVNFERWDQKESLIF